MNMRAHTEAPAGIVPVRARRSVRGVFAIAVLGIGVTLDVDGLVTGRKRLAKAHGWTVSMKHDWKVVFS
jgi:hypothetical protein